MLAIINSFDLHLNLGIRVPIPLPKLDASGG